MQQPSKRDGQESRNYLELELIVSPSSSSAKNSALKVTIGLRLDWTVVVVGAAVFDVA